MLPVLESVPDPIFVVLNYHFQRFKDIEILVSILLRMRPPEFYERGTLRYMSPHIF